MSEAGRYQLAEHVVSTWPGELVTQRAVSTLTGAVAALAGEIAEHGLRTTVVREFLLRIISEIESKAPEGRSKQPRAEIRSYLERMSTRVALMDLVDAFTEAKRAEGVIDFGDQVRIAADIAQKIPAAGAIERAAYKVVLLDEYQDTSIAQVQLLSALFGAGHPVTAVGDPHQAIYGWRGAAAGTLLKFPHQFASARGPAAVATLSTAWRNSKNILQAANKIAAPLREGAKVPELRPRDGAGDGEVSVFYGQTIDEESAHIVEFLRGLGWGSSNDAPPSTAVLVRARKSFGPIAEALSEAGIPHHISGLGGLLQTPEVADLRAALTVVHDPSRSDVLMRLLTGPRMRIGPRDLNVMHAWAKELAKQRKNAVTEESAAAPVAVEEVEAASIVEALQHLPPEHYTARDSTHVLSAEGRARLQNLGEQLRAIRSLVHLRIPDLISSTEQILGLDIDVIAYRAEGTERHNLDAFLAVGESFVSSTRAPDLGGFLEWLAAAEVHERGLDTVEADPDPSVVQLMTIHAAKGLEWDAVVVAGMGDGLFPSIKESKGGQRRSTGWLGAIDLLPYELRGDAENLPSFDHQQADTHSQMKEVDEAFQAAEGNRLLLEERRLAYVAITRAREHVLLTGSFWVPGRATPYPPSIFLTETTRAGLGIEPVALQPDADENPLDDAAPEAIWPPEVPGTHVLDTTAPNTDPGVEADDDPLVEHWRSLAELLLAEREEESSVAPTQVEHLSASRIVAAARDVETFTKNLRRPIPQEPSDRARKGTEFHTWVEQHFNSPALVEWSLMPGADDDGAGGDFEALSAAFLASPWAQREPVALEADVETTVAGLRVRSRIDAVFTDDDGAFHVVDWKTGRPPRTPEEERVRMIQLQLYRLAWARAKGIPLEKVRASFYYVADDLTTAAPDIGAEEIIDQVGAHIEQIFAP